uniref:Phage-Barnase-EndoU-ColicinE5/D-RelE like nuclease 3 domain-containing protein n=1 Tax=Salmonella berta TaxID=28142 RepID=O52167_SALBE|nr:hypothetical protein [Salmonella enterica]AAB91550.1 hypothetical protein [Salmonella enterica subsp. enterica serovar Berta]
MIRKQKMHEWLSVMEVNFSRTAKHECRLSRRKIILKLGDSGFYNKRTESLEGAYGLRHIWDKHRVEIGATSAEDIVIFLESILLAGAEVLIDPKKGQNKAIVVESGTGMMILELKKPNGEDPYYSIITAYDRKSHPGTKLHTLI